MFEQEERPHYYRDREPTSASFSPSSFSFQEKVWFSGGSAPAINVGVCVGCDRSLAYRIFRMRYECALMKQIKRESRLACTAKETEVPIAVDKKNLICLYFVH